MKVQDGIADILKREGVQNLIAYPVNHIIEAAARRDIRTIIVRQERTGLHMADAFSRVNSGKKLGIFAMQHGPGTENSFGGVTQAYGESAPILVLPAGYERAISSIAPNFSAYLNYQHVTKACEQLTDPTALTDVMRRSFQALRAGRPGPVMVEIPADVLGAECDSTEAYETSFGVRSGPDPAAVGPAVEALLGAAQPILYAGQGVHYAEAWDALRELAELLDCPVTTSLGGKSAFPEDHPLSLGSGGRAVPRAVRRFLDESDVILGVGCSFTRTGFGVAIPPGKTVIHSTLDANDINKDVRAQHALVGDAQLCLEAILAEVKKRRSEPADTGVRDKIAALKQEWLAEWAPKINSDDTPLSPYRVIRDLHATVDIDNTIITHDAGSPRDQMSPFWSSTTPLSYLGWGKTTQLGYGLGLAMGAKLARPEKLCINVWGDAAIGFTGMDFETAVRERLPILSVLFNNFSMAIELPIMKSATEKYRSTDISGHYADMAKAFGGYGERVATPADIIPAIQRGIAATEAGQPALLEFITAKEIEISKG